MNTATYRKQAQEHEDKLEWGHAADAWQAAIDYLSAKAAHSELYQADIKRMEERRNACVMSLLCDDGVVEKWK
jgi:hypothetical protein